MTKRLNIVPKKMRVKGTKAFRRTIKYVESK
jgi:hypothetical protein